MRCCSGVPEGTASLNPSSACFPASAGYRRILPRGQGPFTTSQLVDVLGIATDSTFTSISRLNLPVGFQPVATSRCFVNEYSNGIPIAQGFVVENVCTTPDFIHFPEVGVNVHTVTSVGAAKLTEVGPSGDL